MCAQKQQKQEMASFLSCLGETDDAKATLHAEIRSFPQYSTSIEFFWILVKIVTINHNMQDKQTSLHTDILYLDVCPILSQNVGRTRIARLYHAYIEVLHSAMLSTFFSLWQEHASGFWVVQCIALQFYTYYWKSQSGLT